MLDLTTLTRMVDSHEIDTVLVVFPDQQGRLVGKRVTGHHFLDEVVEGGIECCNYLLTVDVDMHVLPGYRFANWDKGYGDVACRPDLTTLRLVPWLEGTALVVCDLFDLESDAPVEVAPRRILQRQIERAHDAGFDVMTASELEFFVFRESYDEAAARGYRDLTPQNDYVLDYHILQTTKDEYLIRAIRNGMDAAGIPVEFSKGEAEAGQHEINLRYADALTMADRHVVYKNGVKEIAALHGQSVSFMAKYDIDRVGSSCHIHSSLWPTDGDGSAMPDANGAHGMSDTARWWLGGLMAAARELAWCFAPYVNSYKRYQPGVVGTDRDRVGARQPHAWASASSATVMAAASSAASPAPMRTPTTRSRRRSRAACTASSTRSSRVSPTSATATPQATCPACRTPSSRRSSCSKALRSRRRRSVRTCTSTC